MVKILKVIAATEARIPPRTYPSNEQRHVVVTMHMRCTPEEAERLMQCWILKQDIGMFPISERDDSRER